MTVSRQHARPAEPVGPTGYHTGQHIDNSRGLQRVRAAQLDAGTTTFVHLLGQLSNPRPNSAVKDRLLNC